MPEKMGEFITVHGIDGTGKTTTTKKVVDVLNQSGEKAVNYDEYKEGVENPHTDKKEEAKESGALDDQLAAYLESMMYHSTQIEKLLAQGYHVVKSRYLDDIKAHFSHLGIAEEKLIELGEKFPMVQPDLKVILLLEESERRRRLDDRGVLNERDSEPKNPNTRLGYFEDYLLRASEEAPADSVLHVDTGTLDATQVAKKIIDHIISQKKPKPGFNTPKYLESQTEKFYEALTNQPDNPAFLEFGGKPFSDHHAERVMPGYEADCKAEILREVVKLADVVMVVNSLDILIQPDGRKPKGRIRGDSGLIYDRETIRLIEEAHKKQIPIDKAVLAVTPQEMTDDNRRRIDKFREDLRRINVTLLTNFGIEKYPGTEIFADGKNPFEKNDAVRVDDGNLVVVSPGGGSGKFGVLLSEMYRSLTTGQTPNYVKFETFPIYQLETTHALNLAFEAATADLGNRVLDVRTNKQKGPRTSYDKDIENFILLKKLFQLFGKGDKIYDTKDAVDMGINRIIDGITDMDIVIEACRQEIIARILRYEKEVEQGIEKIETVDIARQILGKFNNIYQIK